MTCKNCEGYDTAFGCGLFKCNNILSKRLAVYTEAEEQGLLVRLPCKVGDTIYVIFDGKIWDGEVYHISYSDYYGKITATAWVKQGISAAFEHFGKTVFLTLEEAEAALKGLKEAEENE